jgi:hypothetical protein
MPIESASATYNVPEAQEHQVEDLKMRASEHTTINFDDYTYIFMKNVDIGLKSDESGILRCNLYLPKDAAPLGKQKYPVIVTYGPCVATLTFYKYSSNRFDRWQRRAI